MKFCATFCLALCLLVVMGHAVPVHRESLLSIEHPVETALEDQTRQLRRVARQGIYPYGGFHGGGSSHASATSSASSGSNFNGGFHSPYGGYGGYGGYPGFGGGYGGYPGGFYG